MWYIVVYYFPNIIFLGDYKDWLEDYIKYCLHLLQTHMISACELPRCSFLHLFCREFSSFCFFLPLVSPLGGILLSFGGQDSVCFSLHVCLPLSFPHLFILLQKILICLEFWFICTPLWGKLLSVYIFFFCVICLSATFYDEEKMKWILKLCKWNALPTCLSPQ